MIRYLLHASFILLLLSHVRTAAQIPFTEKILIDNTGATSVFVADLDNDGDPDIAGFEGGRHNGGQKLFAWFENKPDESWPKHGFHNTISPGPFTGDSEVADINQDGALDFVLVVDKHSSSGDSHVYWWENPVGSGGSATDQWIPHTIATNMTNCYHMQGLDIVDMDKDGLLDIVVRNLGVSAVRIYFQNLDSAWSQRVIPIMKREGQKVADIDRDGTPDIIFNGFWLAGPNNPRTETYPQYVIEDDYYTLPNSGLNNSVKIDVGDLDKDGKDDVLYSVAEGSSVRLAWFKAPDDPRTETWIEETIENNFKDCHQAILVDLDLDGDLDIAGGFAFSSTGVKNWYNIDGLGGSWSSDIIDASGHMYSEVVSDIDLDGDLDLIGPKKYTGSIYLYKNLYIDSLGLTMSDAPIFSTPSGSYLSPFKLGLSTTSPDAEIRYTVDESEPDTNAMLYVDSILVDTTTTIKARAFETDLLPSQLVTMQYVVAKNGNFPPSACAETSIVAAIETIVVLDGSCTTDADDSIGSLTFEWTQVVGTPVNVINDGSPIAQFITNVIGLYQFNLRVFDENDTSNFLVDVQITNPEQGLIAHWPLDDTVGSEMVRDRMGAHHGSVISGVTWQPDHGINNGAAEFIDPGGLIEVPSFDLIGDQVSIATWIKAKSFTEPEARFISKAAGTGSSDHYWMLSAINATGIRFRLKTDQGGTSTMASEAGLLNLDKWHFVVGTYDGQYLRIFLDGLIIDSLAKTGNISSGLNVPMGIGNQPTGAGERPFDGYLDDIRIYDIALNPTDIANLMSLIPCQTTVNNGTSSGPGSLSAALHCAQSGDTVLFTDDLSGQTLQIATEITLNKNLVFKGPQTDPIVLEFVNDDLFAGIPGTTIHLEHVSLKSSNGLVMDHATWIFAANTSILLN